MSEKKAIILDGKGTGKLVFPVQRYHVVVSRNLDSDAYPAGVVAHTWSQQIFVPFVPDEVIVRSASYTSPDIEPHVFVIQCFTIGEPLAVLTNVSTFCPLTVFDLRGKTVNSNWQFQFQHIDGDPATNAAGQLGFLLEFVKH